MLGVIHLIKRIIIVSMLIGIIIFIGNIFLDIFYNSVAIGYMETIEKGKIVELITMDNEEQLKVKILTGKYKNKYCIIDNVYYQSDYNKVPLKNGNKIVLKVDDSKELPEITLTDYRRDKYVFCLTLFFFVLLLFIGKKKGIKSAVSLIITIVVIIYFMIPLILKGHNPILAAIIACIIITIITLFIVTGISSKSIATILGTSFGVIAAGLLAYITGKLAHFSGLSSHEATSLMFLEQEMPFDFAGILFAGIIIGTLGAVMDVSMSIASSMHEIKENNPEISKLHLIKSGLNIGKDVMGTMTNTLILAYTGTSIPLLMIFIAQHMPLIIILNTELISTEITRALAGSIGIILSIPATSVISGILLSYRNTLN